MTPAPAITEQTVQRVRQGNAGTAQIFRSRTIGTGSGLLSGNFFFSSLVVFLSLSLFYQLAPRRPTRFAEVWIAALCATAMLYAAEHLFVVYLKDFATLNAVYGAFGGIMALLLWIYLFGCILIFGACLCAAQAEERSTEASLWRA